MSTSTYINIPPIKGESSDVDHTDWIEVESFSISEAQSVSDASSTGGLVATQAMFGELSIVKLIDKSSPDVNLHCAQGTSIDELELQVCVETGSKEWYVQIKLTHVVISSVSLSGGGMSRPTENVTFAYGQIDWDYKPIGADGAVGSAVGPKGWNIETGDPK